MNLLVSDFDDTFYDNNYEENIKFVNSLDNFDFVVATGRNYQSLKKDLKVECKYYICNDGGYILDKDENIIYNNYINNESLKKIYERMKKLRYDDYFFDYLTEFGTELKPNINKLSIRIKNNTPEKDLEYLLKDIDDVYGYISNNWINILNVESKKENAVEKIIGFNKYENIFTVGNEINDYGMLKKYNGYLISKQINTNFNTISKFIDIKKKLD